MWRSEIAMIASLFLALVIGRYLRKKKPGLLAPKLLDSSTPENAFKSSVCPLAGLCVLCAGMMLLKSTTWSAEDSSLFPFPFIPGPLKAYFFPAIAILNLLIGVGLFFRFRPAWFLFLAYMAISPVYLILGIGFDYFPGLPPKTIIIPVTAIFSALLFAALYRVTKPAFRRPA